MCVERMRSIILAIIIGFALGFLATNVKIAFIIYLILIIALLLDGFIGFCPLRMLLKTLLPECK